jgi:2,4-dienoyl-CoA reductase-like NADH-dependent reductase (Old Yellow Enzyme family)/thioredoxin reductase
MTAQYNDQFEMLFKPGKIGSMEIKNRIIMAPMITEYADVDGYVTQRLIDYYAERAKGGVGLIMVEASYVQWPIGKGFSRQIALYDDKYIPGLTKLADAIKKNGARAVIEIHHVGGAGKSKLMNGHQPVAPSAVSFPGYEATRAMSVEEIKESVNCFVEAAVRCEKAGFDAINIHACHHYLLANFLSPAWNQRTDEFGGDIKNRARPLLSVLKGVKQAVNVPVICRINVAEMGAKELFGVQKELTVEDAIETAKLLEANGVNAVHLTARGYGAQEVIHMMPLYPGQMLGYIERIKKVVSIPVIAFGRLTPEVGEQALRERKADFIGIGRGLLADPYLPEKVAAGELSDIAPCICCFNCIQVSSYGYQPGLKCTVNARCGREGEFESMGKVKEPRRVFVVGGGPAGMETARVAALRGHHVTLFEKQEFLGGQMVYADKASYKYNVTLLREYLAGQIKKYGVKVELGKSATQEMILREKPDIVVVATGAVPLKPSIKGLDERSALYAIDVLSGKAEVGENVVVIGGDMVGCEVAEVLADRGRKVTICEMLPELLTKMAIQFRRPVLAKLKEKGIDLRPNTTARMISKEGVTVVCEDGKEQLLKADTVVLACGSESVNGLVSELKGKVAEVYCIGDAKEPRKILEAIHEGFEVAHSF